MNTFVRAVGVELTRLRWRRAVVLLLIAAVAVPALFLASTAYNTRSFSDAEVAEAQAQVDADTQSYGLQEVDRCVKRPGRYGVGKADDVQAACEEAVLPRLEYYLYRDTLDLDYERTQSSGIGVVTVLIVLMMLMGTTFAGHDWATGSMSNQVLFQSRRMLVWAAKAVAVTLTALVVCLVVAGAYWLALRGIAGMRDVPVRSGALHDGLLQGARGSVFAAAAALGGFALTMLFRSTVLTLGVLFGISVAGGIAIGLIGTSDIGRWEPTVNAAAIVQDGAEYYRNVPNECFSGNPPTDPKACEERRKVTLGQGGRYYGGVLLLAGVPSLLLFRRRDMP